MSKDVPFDEFSILHSKSIQDSSKAKDVTTQVEFETTTIKNSSDQQHFEAFDDTDQNHQTQP